MGFGTRIPATVENAVAIRVAVLRGAARNFNKRWGVAFYHPNDVKLKSASIPLLYEKGASCFWYWTGWIGITDNSGLPYPYQIYYTSLVREAFARNPNRDMDALLHAAKVAVVIPYGYTFSPYHMHRIDWLHLERENPFGVTYREVLTNAALEVERLLRAGIDFDIAVDDPLFHKTGYDHLIYAQADGTVRIEREGETEAQYPNARPVDRLDLGPAPQLTLEVVESEDGKAGKLRVRAIAEIGTGEWAGERPEPLISWEIYGPDNKVSPSIFPEYGAVRTLQLDDSVQYTLEHPVSEHLRKRGRKAVPVEGSYTIRAASADVFGRPAVAHKTIYVQAATAQGTVPPELVNVKKTVTPIDAFVPVAQFDRHDPSNVVLHQGRYWFFYTRNAGNHADVTIHAAHSQDGLQWTDAGQALGRGAEGAWDESGTIAPYVVPHDGKYYLFYTGFRNGDLATRDLGCAVADTPAGPWQRWEANPILKRSTDPEAWDSGMLGDSNVIFREGRWWLYFKSRRDRETNVQTRIGVASSDSITGPYEKSEGNPLFPGHAFSAWVHRTGVAAICGIVTPKILWAEDGLRFVEAGEMPNTSTGFYCPSNFAHGNNAVGVSWGIEAYAVDGHRGLRRFECTMEVAEPEE